MESPTPPTTVDEYIARQLPEVRGLLESIRAVVKAAAPSAVEKISYAMPGYSLNGYLVGFAAQARHIGFYPTPSGIEAFREHLAGYKTSKGAVQFPMDQPLPFELIRKMVEYRVAQQVQKA